MATHLCFGSGHSAYEIHIRPLKEKQETEDFKISVKSLVNSYDKKCFKAQSNKQLLIKENDKEREKDCNEQADATNQSKSLLPDLIVSSRSRDVEKPEPFENNPGSKSQHYKPGTQQVNTNLEKRESSDAEFLLYKTLKDIFDGHEKEKQLIVKPKSDHRLQRLKISKKPDYSVVSEIFDRKAEVEQDMGIGSDHSKPFDRLHHAPHETNANKEPFCAVKSDPVMKGFQNKYDNHVPSGRKLNWPYNSLNNVSFLHDCYERDVGRKEKLQKGQESSNMSRNVSRTDESFACQEVLNIVLIESASDCVNLKGDKMMPWKRSSKGKHRPGLPWQMKTNLNNTPSFRSTMQLTPGDANVPYRDQLLHFTSDLSSESRVDDTEEETELDDEESIFKPLEDILKKFGGASSKESWLEEMCESQRTWAYNVQTGKVESFFQDGEKSLTGKEQFSNMGRRLKAIESGILESEPVLTGMCKLSEADSMKTRQQQSILKTSSVVREEVEKPQLKKICKRVSFAQPEPDHTVKQQPSAREDDKVCGTAKCDGDINDRRGPERKRNEGVSSNPLQE